MSHDTALKLLGLSGGQNKTKAGVGGTSQVPRIGSGNLTSPRRQPDA